MLQNDAFRDTTIEVPLHAGRFHDSELNGMSWNEVRAIE